MQPAEWGGGCQGESNIGGSCPALTSAAATGRAGVEITPMDTKPSPPADGRCSQMGTQSTSVSFGLIPKPKMTYILRYNEDSFHAKYEIKLDVSLKSVKPQGRWVTA